MKITKRELKKVLIKHDRSSEIIRIRECLYRNRKDLVGEILKYSAKKIEIAMKSANGWDFKVKN